MPSCRGRGGAGGGSVGGSRPRRRSGSHENISRSRGPSADWSPPQGDWLRAAELLPSASSSPEPDEALAEAAELGLDTKVCGSLLAGLRRDPPPRYADARVAALSAAEANRGGPLAPNPAHVRPPRPALPLASRVSQALPASLSAVASAIPHEQRKPSRSMAGAPSQTEGSGSAASPRSAAASPSPLHPAGAAARGPSPGRKGLPPMQSASKPRKSQDESLVASMAARLAQVEQLNQSLSAKLSEQSQELAAVREENIILRRSAEEVTSGTAGADSSRAVELAALCAERDQLRCQLQDISKFLEGYGLRWSPTNRSASAAADIAMGCRGSGTVRDAPTRSSGSKSGAASDAPGVAGMAVDIRVIKARVEGLNAMIEQESRPIVSNAPPGAAAVQAHFGEEMSTPLPLSFFGDGIKLGDRAFLPYDQRPAQDLLRDILDGCFPRCLQEDYPDGATMQVVDRVGHQFANWLRDCANDDAELADGGERIRPGVGAALHAPSEAKTAAERLVAKMPERVLRNGRVCEVRGPLAAKLGVATSAASSSPPATSHRAGDDMSLLNSGRDESSPVARLQVKLEGGQRVTLCMEPTATIGALWGALERWRAEHGVARACAGGRRCSLRTAFPPCAYNDHDQTLEAAGLTPSATLFVSVDVDKE